MGSVRMKLLVRIRFNGAGAAQQRVNALTEREYSTEGRVRAKSGSGTDRWAGRLLRPKVVIPGKG